MMAENNRGEIWRRMYISGVTQPLCMYSLEGSGGQYELANTVMAEFQTPSQHCPAVPRHADQALCVPSAESPCLP